MGHYLRWAAGSMLGLSLCALPSQVLAAEEAVVDLPSPFAAVAVHTESVGAKWRHGFHDMRKTWDKYFEVYPKELDGHEATSFEKVRAEPAFFLDRKIRMDLYFAKTGTFYRPFTSPFHSDGYVNFNAWGMNSELWNKEGRAEVHPLFYIDKRLTKLTDSLAHLPTYTPIHVWCIVRAKSENMPWIEIKGFEIIPDTVLSESALKHLEMGAVQLAKKRFDLAAQTLELALKDGLPVNVEAKAYSMLGSAYYEQRIFNRARYSLVQSVLRNDRVFANLIMLARSDLRLDRADEARQACECLLKQEPSNAEAHAELGLALAMLGDIKGAHREIDFAQKLAPRGQLTEAHRNRALVFVREGKLALAKEEMSKAVLLRATDFSLHIELGDVYLALNSLAESRQEYQQSKDLAGLRPEPYFKLASVCKMQGDALVKENKADDAKKLFEEALTSVQTAITKDASFAPAFVLEAELLRALGREVKPAPKIETPVEESKKVLLNELEPTQKPTPPVAEEKEITDEKALEKTPEPLPVQVPGDR
jgi:Flp pilus assembly protein TadD